MTIQSRNTNIWTVDMKDKLGDNKNENSNNKRN